MSLGQVLLSERASVTWIVVRYAVPIFHYTHLVRMRGERRWYDSAHVTMLVGMLYMHAAVAFSMRSLPTQDWQRVEEFSAKSMHCERRCQGVFTTRVAQFQAASSADLSPIFAPTLMRQ